MNDDKYIGIEVLTNVLNNVIEMVDQRTALLNSMFKEDLYNDFLMMEAMQGGMGGAGVDNVAPVNTGMNDLSLPQAPNDQNIVNLEEAGLNPSDTGNTNLDNPNDDTTTQNYNKGAITPPTSGLSGNALNPFSSEEKPSSKSLEETGFNDVIERNISNSIADDFQIDQRLKDAFGSSLALPMKAAGVGLMGLLSRIPATDADMQNNIDNFLTQMSTSLGVSTESSTLNSSTDNKENIDLSTRIQNWVHKAADWLVSKPKNDDPMGGSVTKIHGINQGGGGIGSTISNLLKIKIMKFLKKL